MTSALKKLRGQLQLPSAKIPNHAVNVSEHHLSCGLRSYTLYFMVKGSTIFGMLNSFETTVYIVFVPKD